MNYALLGEILKKTRVGLRMTQQDIAEQLNITSSNVSSWERGKSKIDIRTYIKICSIYEIDYLRLLEMAASNASVTIPEEDLKKLQINESQLIEKYRLLDERGKKAVNETLNRELHFSEEK